VRHGRIEELFSSDFGTFVTSFGFFQQHLAQFKFKARFFMKPPDGTIKSCFRLLRHPCIGLRSCKPDRGIRAGGFELSSASERADGVREVTGTKFNRSF